jgi:predicted GNAT superfamily acetyltransferase
MRRAIDPDRESAALDWLAEELEDVVVAQARGGSMGARCVLLDIFSTAMSHGARASSCAEYVDVASRTVEHWRIERRDVLAAIDGVWDAKKRK